MFDYGEIAESYALGLIPGYSFYEIYKTRDLPTDEEFIGGLGALLTHACIGARMQRTGLLALAGLVMTTGGETLAELRMLFPRIMGIGGFIGGVAAGATVGYLAGEYVGKPAMKKQEQKFGSHATRTGMQLGWRHGMTVV